MMNKVTLLAAVAVVTGFARPASAQSSFGDVPAQHWANGAVNDLRSRGIITGYPDATFGGKRAVTRYEFALAGQRVLLDAQRRLAADLAGPRRSSALSALTREEADRLIDERLRNVPTRAELVQLRLDVDQLRHTMTRVQTTAATLRTEVDRMKQEVAGMGTRHSGISRPGP